MSWDLAEWKCGTCGWRGKATTLEGLKSLVETHHCPHPETPHRGRNDPAWSVVQASMSTILEVRAERPAGAPLPFLQLPLPVAALHALAYDGELLRFLFFRPVDPDDPDPQPEPPMLCRLVVEQLPLPTPDGVR